MASWMNNDAEGVIQFHVTNAELQEEHKELFNNIYAIINVDDVSLSTDIKTNTTKPNWDEILTFARYIPSTCAKHSANIVIKAQKGDHMDASDEVIGIGTLTLSNKFDMATDMWDKQFVDINNENIPSTRVDGYLMGYCIVAMRTLCQSHFREQDEPKKIADLIPNTNGNGGDEGCCNIL